jgi:glycosyltransferase involved in cell wall biosynthesis
MQAIVNKKNKNWNRFMKIIHVGNFRLGTANGNFNAIWSLAKAQAALGHEVSIIQMRKLPNPNDVPIAEKNGIRLVGYPFPKRDKFVYWRDYENKFENLIERLQPDIVHLQYVRIPKFYAISNILHKKKIPYVISLHGGLNSTEMKRKRVRKKIYWNVVEKFVHQNARAIHFISTAERDDYYKTLGTPKINDTVVFNAVQIEENGSKWRYENFNARAPKVAFFGRYDIWHKGIDLAVDLVRRLNRAGIAAELHLHGLPNKRDVAAIKRLLNNADIPIFDHGYSDGEKMLTAMASYDLYLQYSRFELFGLSLVEAISLGVPALVSEACDLAPELVSQCAAIQISLDPKRAAETVVAALRCPEELKRIGDRGRSWAIEHCEQNSVALQMTKFYEGVINE